VIGVWNSALATEVPMAFVVRQGGAGARLPGDDQRILDWLAGQVADHMRLRGGVKFIDEIPKSVSGKVLRRVLKERAMRDNEGGVVKANL
jgi:4-coumarate--CoA ligase